MEEVELPSTKPYLLRALWEWCCDNGFTPHILVEVDKATRVPPEFVRDGQIILNVGPTATNKLHIGNEYVEFQARFGGTPRELLVPIGRISTIYARENGAGMSFDIEETQAAVAQRISALPTPAVPATTEAPEPPPESPRPSGGRPWLQRIK